jgi:hypothetical protein
MTINANRVTISNVSNPVAVTGLIYGVNVQSQLNSEDSNGNIDANISNLTVERIQSDALSAALGTQNVNSSSSDIIINNNYKKYNHTKHKIY